jgi:hypothetical protein
MGAEFVAMIAVLGSMKLAMVTGQVVMKGFHATMVGLGAAAGIAIGAIAGVLGAMRELNVAKMQPLFIKANGGKNLRNAQGGAATMQQFFGDPSLAGFGEQAISGAMTAQMQAGGKANGAFRGQLTRYGDFTGGDPKALQAISSAMSTAQFKGTGKMKGKISGETYAEMQKSAPGMAAAFEEMAGGANKANAAAAAGKISFDAFNAAIMEGKLKALEPYNGALAAINNTVIMKLKANLAGLKEQITSVGLGSFKELYGKDSPRGSTGGPGGGRSIVDAIRDSVDKLGTSLKISLATVAPIIQKTMPGIVDGMSKPLTFLNEKLVVLITRGMNSIESFDNSFNVWIGNIRNWFSQIAAYITPFAAAWDTVWKALLQPILSGVGEVFGAWLGSINSQVAKGQSIYAQWGINIKETFHNISELVKSLNHFKDIMGPIIGAILRFVNLFSKLLAIPFVAGVMAWVVGIKLAYSIVQRLAGAFLKASVNLRRLTEEQRLNNTVVAQAGFLTDKQISKLGQKNAMAVARQSNSQAITGGMTRANNFFRGQPVVGPVAGFGTRGPGAYARYKEAGGFFGTKMQYAPGTTTPIPSVPGGGYDTRGPSLMSRTGSSLMNKAAASENLGSGLAMGGSMAATALGGYISSRAGKTSSAGQGVGGALSGAGTGAMLGMMVGGPAGAAIGAAGGAIVGGTMGVLNARKAQSKQKKEDEKKITDKIYGGREAQTVKAVAIAEKRAKKFKTDTLKINALTAKINGMIWDPNATAAEKHALEKKRDALEKNLDIESGTGAMKGINKVLKGIDAQKRSIKANNELGAMVGVSADKLAGWADRNHKKLGKAIISLKDLQDLAGYGSDMSESERRAVAATRLGNTLNQSNSKAVEAAQSNIDVVNARSSYYEIARGPMSKDQRTVETGKLGSAIATRQAAAYSAGAYGTGKDSYKNMVEATVNGLRTEVTSAQNFGVVGDNLTALQQMTETQIKDLNDTIGDFTLRSQADPNFIKDYAEQVRKLTSSAIPANLKTPAQQAAWIASNKKTLDDWLAAQGITQESIIKSSDGITSSLTESLDKNGVTLSTNLRNGLEQGGERAAKLIEIAMDKDSTTTVKGQIAKWANADKNAAAAALSAKIVADNQVALLEQISAYDQMIAGAGDNQVLIDGFTAVRNLLVEAFKNPTGMGDTATPRFNRTLQSHGALDNMISGKRTITSGIRSTNLGSINSDHLTGRAYDLIGQNLGAYASNVKATGGFAEFHGTGGSRHLHVVPGAMGDTASPVGIGMGGPAGTVNNYNIVVNPPPGSSPEAIANEVMNRIAVRQRDSLERR